ncbi:DUF982 domain-containing protein [Chelativorans salis]|uniref:DUF982 domain-containing protein n=1 Tax=Chelativorans salis TaxID=2978478 RepID=UPI003CC5876E
MSCAVRPLSEPTMHASRFFDMRDPFEQSVSVTFGQLDTARTVASVEQAAEILMDPRWPNRGPRHTRACAALLDWSERPSQPQAVRVWVTFCKAAQEAGILMSARPH